MATLSVQRVMERVSLVADCESDAEAERIYDLLVSQILDGGRIVLVISEPNPKGKTNAM